jgi:TP901 family phage tail tape measure protein
MGIAAMRVPTVFTAIDRFSDVVDRMTSKTSRFGESASAAADRVGNRMRNVGSNMMIASGAMLATLAVPMKKAVEFEDQMASINTLLNLEPKGIKNLGDQLIRMSMKTSTPINELTKSYYDLISAGVKMEDAMSWLKDSDRLAITGLGTLPESTNIMLATMRNFGKDFKDTDDAANALFKTVKFGKTTVAQLSEAYAKNAVSAGLLGIKGQEYNSLIAAMTTSTLPTSETENMIGNLSIALQKGKGKLPKIFSSLGVKNAQQLLQKTGNFENMLLTMDKKAKQLGISVNAMFPLKGASTAFTMFTKNQQVLDKYRESLKSISDRNENALGKGFILKQATGKFGMGVLTNNLNAMAITVGTDLIPALLELTKLLNPLLKRFSQFIKDNPGVVTSFAKIALAVGAIGAAVSLGGWMVKLYGFFLWLGNLSYVAAVIDTITFAFSLLAVALGVSVGVLAVVVVAAVLAIIAIFYYWDEICAWFSKQWGDFTSYISDAWNNVVDAFSSGRIIEGFKNIGRVLIDVVLYPLQQIMNLASKIPGMSFLYSGVTSIQGMRDKYGVQQANKYQKIDSAEERQTKISGGFKGSLEVNVKDKGGNVESVQKSWDDLIPIKISQTTGSSVWSNNK